MLAENIKHLELIQKTVERLAANAFTIKGICVPLVSAVVGAAATHEPKLFWLGLFAVAVCWALDSYYLSLERQFRSLYEKVRKMPGETDFSMRVDGASVGALMESAARLATAGLYGPLTVALVAVFWLAKGAH